MSKDIEYKVGMIVEFGRPNGEKTQGKIVKVNPKKIKVEQIGTRGVKKTYDEGALWTVPKREKFVKIISNPQVAEDLGVVNHKMIHRMVEME